MFGNKNTVNHAVWRITMLAAVSSCAVICCLLLYAVIPRDSEGNSSSVAHELPVEGLQKATLKPLLSPPKRDSLISTISFEQSAAETERDRPGQGATADPWEQSAEAFNADFQSVQQEIRPKLSINLRHVDDLIRQGNYGFASELLEEFEGQASGLVKVQIRLRRGLCAELEGDPGAALSHYRSLADTYQLTAIADAAAVATARVLIERGRRDIGTAMLMRLLLGRESSMRKELRGDVVHTLASGLVPAVRRGSPLSDSEWPSAKYTSTPEQLLSRWSMLDAGKRLPLRQGVLNLRQLTSDPEGILISLESQSSGVFAVLERIAGELKWSLNLEDSVRKTLNERTMMLDCEELPLDVAFDALLKPNGFGWSYENNSLTVQRNLRLQSNDDRSLQLGDVEEDHEARVASQLMVAGRFQQLAVNLAPEHPAAASSYVLLGATTAKHGDFDRAVRLLQTAADTFPRSPAIGTINLCLGKAELIRGQREDALKHFYRTVDRVSGLETDTIAYIYIGRILLENDTPRDAISPLMRGLSMSEETEYEAPAALLLSSAYLLNGNAAGANAVLLKHRLAFEYNAEQSPVVQSEIRKMSRQAALISSLARFWGTNGTQRIREGRALLSALTNVRAEECFGGHSAYLVGVAFAAVGLDSERDAVFHKSMAGSDRFPLQEKMGSLLTGQLQTENSLQRSESSAVETEARDISAAENLTAVPQRGSTDRAVLVNAEANFRNGQHAEVLKSCQQFLQDASRSNASPEIRKSMLRLMGLVYQTQGKHQLAIRCLAGLPPTAENQADSSTDSKGTKL